MQRILKSLRSRKTAAGAGIVFAAAIAAVVLLSGSATRRQLLVSQKPIGSARLIAVEQEPSAECQWEPASYEGSMPLRELLEAESAAASSATDQPATKDFSQRKPVRQIHDPYAAYSAVAVDVKNNEVVLTDENLFNILAYDRTANTPPSATMTEPKRTIGGLNTNIEFQCGLYVDPNSGDIYAVNNDTIDQLVIFSRNVRGDQPPTREIHTPHGTFGIAVNEATQELFMTVQHDSAIVVYNKMAKGEDAPIRMVQGDHTKLADPHGITIDTKNHLLYVTNHGSVHEVRADIKSGRAARGEEKPNWPLDRSKAVPGSGKMIPPSITVYDEKASGDAAPVRMIQGPKTQMDWPTGVAVDERTGEIFVANDGGSSILVFSADASGDAAPIRVLKGPKSLVKNPTGIYLDEKNNELWVANFGNHTAAVYNPTASGDTPPLRVIRSAPLNKPTPSLGNPHPLAYDTKREEILVPN